MHEKAAAPEEERKGSIIIMAGALDASQCLFGGIILVVPELAQPALAGDAQQESKNVRHTILFGQLCDQGRVLIGKRSRWTDRSTPRTPCPRR